MRVVVLLNAGAGPDGRGTDPAAVAEAFAAAGVEADLRPTPGPELVAAARAAAAEGFDCVVAAGGDGTVSTVASALAGTGATMGVLPAGTLNHFAKDLALPQGVADAARVIAAGRARAVDAAEVNGRTFVNNASIGLYPHIVSKRDRQRERLGRNKWLAMLLAAVAVFRRYPVVNVVLDTGERDTAADAVRLRRQQRLPDRRPEPRRPRPARRRRALRLFRQPHRPVRPVGARRPRPVRPAQPGERFRRPLPAATADRNPQEDPPRRPGRRGPPAHPAPRLPQPPGALPGDGAGAFLTRPDPRRR